MEIEGPIGLAFGAGTGVVLFGRGFRHWRRLRWVEDTPTARVRSMPLGRVEVQGRAQAKAELEAPLTGTPCVYYRFRVEEERGSGRHRRWVTVAQGDSAAWGFYLEDDTGRALVDPTGAEIDIPHDWRETNPEIGARLSGVLDEHGVASNRWWGLRGKLRFTEWHISPGDPVYVLGVAQERSGIALERRQRISEKLAALRSDPEAMAHFDADGDGHVDAHEWEVARRLAVEEIQAIPLDDPVVIGRAPHGECPFYISDRAEMGVLQRHRWKSILYIFGGAALAIGCAVLLLRNLGIIGRIW
jgi:hypothetical protein